MITTREYHVDISHRDCHSDDFKESNVHGHTFTVTVSAENADRIELDTVVSPILRMFDRAFIVEDDDELLEIATLISERMIAVPYIPNVGNLSAHLFALISRAMQASAKLKSVVLDEGCQDRAITEALDANDRFPAIEYVKESQLELPFATTEGEIITHEADDGYVITYTVPQPLDEGHVSPCECPFCECQKN